MLCQLSHLTEFYQYNPYFIYSILLKTVQFRTFGVHFRTFLKPIEKLNFRKKILHLALLIQTNSDKNLTNLSP
jgi:hypothetical protein